MTDISPLARQLLARRKHVLDAWCARVDADRTLDDRRQWSRQQFVDHLPELIEQFAAGLAKLWDAMHTAELSVKSGRRSQLNKSLVRTMPAAATAADKSPAGAFGSLRSLQKTP